MPDDIALLRGLRVMAQAAHEELARQYGHGHPSVLATTDVLAALERALEGLESSGQP